MALTQQPIATAPDGRRGQEGSPPPEAGLTTRALLVAVALSVLVGLWVRQAEISVLATQITESVPAIPGLAALVVLLLANALLRRLRGAAPLRRAELLVIFIFVTISSTVMGIGVLQFLFALICAPFYFTESGIPANRPYLPLWLIPHDAAAVRALYVGAPGGRVPWHLWWRPGLCWLGFFVAFAWTMQCLMALFYRAWAEEERLSFPLVALPMEMTRESGPAPFFRNRLMWLGFALAGGYDLVNILHAVLPVIPAFGKEADFSPVLTGPPWSGLAPLTFYFRPEMIGLGYLVSTDISLTVWLSYALMKLAAVAAVSAGYEPKQVYPQEQGLGAYLVLALVLVWQARGHLGRMWRAAWAGRQAVGPEGVSAPAAFAGLFGGFAAVWGFATAAGMAAWVSLAYLGIVLAVALVYGRLRSQTGVPLIWLFPFGMQKEGLLYALGSHPFVASGPTTLPTWAVFTFLARGYYPSLTGYQVEGLELARRARISPARMMLALLLAVAVGFAVGWYNHLVPYYQHGALHGRGGIWGTDEALMQYRLAARLPGTPQPADGARLAASGLGGLIVLGLSALHLRWIGFPLHPLGYAMTCSYGDLIWGSFLVVWLLKTLALRYGGMRFYRTTIPFFLGGALGHLAVAGMFWGVVGAWSGDAVQGYQVWFG